MKHTHTHAEDDNFWSLFSCARKLPQKLREPRGQRPTHPCSQTAVILMVTVPLLEARARAVVFLLHEPVIDSLPRQAGVDYKTVAWNKEAHYLQLQNTFSRAALMFSTSGPSSKSPTKRCNAALQEPRAHSGNCSAAQKLTEMWDFTLTQR